jgi:hypothetical protein
MFTRLFNRRRSLGATEPPDWATEPTEERATVPAEQEMPLEVAQELAGHTPPHGWAHTQTGLLRVVDGLRRY